MTIISFKSTKCVHSEFKVSESLNTIQCGLCDELMNPIWVLLQLCNKEARYHLEVERLLKQKSDLIEEIEMIKNRVVCECERCHKMTRITKG